MPHPEILSDYRSGKKNYASLLDFINSISFPVFRSRLQGLQIDLHSECADFCSDFISNSLPKYRQINSLSNIYQPRSRQEMADFLAFVHQSAINKIQVRPGKYRKLVYLAALSWCDRIHKKRNQVELLHEPLCNSDAIPKELDQKTIQFLLYLESHQPIYRKYLELELQEISPSQIAERLGLSEKKRALIKSSITYHSRKFAAKLKAGLPLDKRMPSQKPISSPLPPIERSMVFVSPKGNRYTVDPDECKKFVRQTGLRGYEVRALARGTMKCIAGWTVEQSNAGEP